MTARVLAIVRSRLEGAAAEAPDGPAAGAGEWLIAGLVALGLLLALFV